MGKVNMKIVQDKKYLGQIVSEDSKNDKNIKEKVNKSFGNVNKIILTLSESPFGKFNFSSSRIDEKWSSSWIDA